MLTEEERKQREEVNLDALNGCEEEAEGASVEKAREGKERKGGKHK